MRWDRGRYYTRSKKVNGRVVRQYVRAGRLGQLAAELDADKREERRLDALAQRQGKAELAALEADIEALIRATDLMARAALVATGFHQHKRGEWRKKRGERCPACSRRTED